MAVRTTSAEVTTIIDTSVSSSDIDTFITTANAVVTDVLGSEGLGSTRLTEIEKYLTAHLLAVTRERQGINEQVGDAKIKYSGTFGKSLESTTYGQTVLMLDTSNKMAEQGMKRAFIQAIDNFD